MSLMKIDRLFSNKISVLINVITFGSKHATLCARLYLYKKYISKNNIVVNILIRFIDSVESGHCETSARHWRFRAKKKKCFFPERYTPYLKMIENKLDNYDNKLYKKL